MRTATVLSAALAILNTIDPAAGAQSADDDNDTSYLNSVCEPQGDYSGPDAVVPPCIDIISIEEACTPNGTSPLALEAHAQCMCGGSYFAEWLGCRQCLFDHGGLSERNLTYYQSVIATASQQLCGSAASLTAAFQTLFSSAVADVPIPTAGGTSLVDIASGNSAVSVYYTAASGSRQGPGAITGSATEATATASTTKKTTADTASLSGSQSTDGTATSTKPTGATSTKATSTSSSSANAAAAPSVVGARNVLLAVAGGALVAAL